MAKQDNENLGAGGCGITAIIVGGVTVYTDHILGGSVLLVLGLLLLIIAGMVHMQDKELKKKGQRDQRAGQMSEFQEEDNQLDIPTISVSITTEDDTEYEYSIKGINFRDIDDSMLGDFVGTARALKSNSHDAYAIGVYRGNRRVGFLPRGNKELHAEIIARGGSVRVDGYIAKAEGEADGRTFYYGKVNILDGF